jgi:hypothetical protein
MLQATSSSQGAPVRAVSVIVAACLVFSSVASAQEAPVPIGQAEMRADLHRFFSGDKRHSLILFSVGVSSLVAGGVLVSQPGFARATSYPLLGVGLLQAIVGGGIYLRTNKQVAALDAQLSSDPGAVKAGEYKRMSRLHLQYRIIEIAEIAMILAGGTLLIVGGTTNTGDQEVLQGVGLGLVITGAVTLPLDLIADRRGERYRKSLSRFQVGMAKLPLPGASSRTPAPTAFLLERRF